MAEKEKCVDAATNDATLLDENNLIGKNLQIYTQRIFPENGRVHKRERKLQNTGDIEVCGGYIVDNERSNVKRKGLDIGDRQTRLKEEEPGKRRKRRKKKKWKQLAARGSVSSIEVNNTNNVVEHDSERRTDFIDNASPYYSVKEIEERNESKRTRAQVESEHDIIVNEIKYKKERSKRKRKKKILDLKKSSSKVGILNHGVLPPIRDNGTNETEAIHEKINDQGSSKDDEGEVGSSSSTHNLVSPSKDTTIDYEKPLKFCIWITRYPLISFFIVSLGHILTFAVTAGLIAGGYDVFPIVFDDLPLIILNDARLKDLAWRAKDNYDDSVYRPVYGRTYPTWYRGRVKDVVEVTLEKPGGNVLTTKNLRLIKAAEDRLFNIPLYQDEFCTVDYYDDCFKPKSILRFFDGTYSHIDPVFSDINFTNVNEVMYKANFYNETKEDLMLFLGRDSVIDRTKSRTAITRILFLMGWPLGKLPSGYYGSQKDVEDFLVNVFKPEIEAIRDNLLVDHLDVYYLSKMLLEHDLIEQAMTDLKLAIGSVLFIFLFMCFQTASVTVTFLGILSILSSFLLTNLIYRYVFQFIYFGFFHVIAIFLILGIGADDLFVFYDTWRLTGNKNYPSDAHRLSDCYRKAAKTTFVTSCTTMMAFLVSGFSPLLPVRTFGIFSGVLVAINYIWVVVYFPTIVILHHSKIKGVWSRVHAVFLRLCISEDIHHPRSRQNSSYSVETIRGNVIGTNNAHLSIITDTYIHDEKVNASLVQNDQLKRNKFQDHLYEKSDKSMILSSKLLSPKSLKSSHEKDSTPHLLGEIQTQKQLIFTSEQLSSSSMSKVATKSSKPKKNFEDRNRVVLCLRNGFFDLISKRPVKALILLIFLGVTSFFIHRATLLEPDTHQLRLFRETHNYAKATMKHYFSFRRNDEDEYTRLYLVWGLQAADISQCDPKSYEFCRGTPVWDDNFDMNSAEAQSAFKELCNRLENMDAKLVDDLRIRRDIATGMPAINCFVKPLENFMKAKTKNYGTSISLELPVSPSNITNLMKMNRPIYRNMPGLDFKNHFEILISYWLTNAYTLYSTPDYFNFNEVVGEKKVHGMTKYAYYDYSGLFYGTKLQYLAIEVNTTMNLYSLGYREGMPVYRKWEELVNNLKEMLPPGTNGVFQVTENLWHWLHVQETLADSAVMGVLVGLFSAWLILILTTFNYIIGTLAVITIGLVTACVIGIIPLAGWRLGVLESINLCMVVGLSVDYVVHLAEAYRMSSAYRRHDRVKDMLQSMGLSVISGALTTIGAAIFMLFAQIQFFFQFGIFIISTIGTSLIFSLIGFTTFLSLCGPQGETGSLRKAARECVQCCCWKTSSKWRETDRENKADKERQSLWQIISPCSLIERLFDRISYGK